MKSSVAALFSLNPMYYVNFMSVKVMLHCTNSNVKVNSDFDSGRVRIVLRPVPPKKTWQRTGFLYPNDLAYFSIFLETERGRSGVDKNTDRKTTINFS